MANARTALKQKEAVRSFKMLNLPTYATEAEVRRAYRSLVRREHPDKGGDAAKFQDIQCAYDNLMRKVSFATVLVLPHSKGK